MAIDMETIFCIWKYLETQNFWATKCNRTYQFQDGGPLQNAFLFCPYCGEAIVIDPRGTRDTSPPSFFIKVNR